MIWVSDTAGDIIFMKADWEALTGQPTEEAWGRGWLAKVHPDDRPIVSDVFEEATSAREQFIVNYRLLRTSGEFCWVVASGTPSIWPESGEFLGYLGALDIIDEIDKRHPTRKATGRIGAIRPPSEVLDGACPTLIEGLADQVIHIRELADEAHEPMIVSIIDLALVEIGYRLAQHQTDGGGQPRRT